MARTKEKKQEQALSAPLWMITYGDLMGLLLCFFVLLFSFSTLDVVKFREVITELQGAFGVLTGGPMVLNLGDIPASRMSDNPAAGGDQMAQLKERLEEKVAEENLQDSVQASIGERGLTLRFTDTVLFDLGKAEIRPEVYPILDAVSEEIALISNNVQVEGHTDPTPIHTSVFPSNWELSTARATAIVHYLIEHGNIEPNRLAAAGYAFYHPVAPNNTPENRTRNRRVDVIILNSEETGDQGDSQDGLGSVDDSGSDGPVMEFDGDDFPESVQTTEDVVSNRSDESGDDTDRDINDIGSTEAGDET